MEPNNNSHALSNRRDERLEKPPIIVGGRLSIIQNGNLYPDRRTIEVTAEGRHGERLSVSFVMLESTILEVFAELRKSGVDPFRNPIVAIGWLVRRALQDNTLAWGEIEQFKLENAI